MAQKIQAKHIPIEFVLELMDLRLQIPTLTTRRPWLHNRNNDLERENPIHGFLPTSVFPRDFTSLWPEIPEKVIRAKLRLMEKKGLVESGSFENFMITDKGREILWHFRYHRNQSDLAPDDHIDYKLNLKRP